MRHLPTNPPPWWPENEPWPPSRPPHWRSWPGRPRRFFWRVGCAVGVLLLLALIGCGSLIWFILGGPSPAGERDVWRSLSLIVIVAGVIGFLWVGRTLRHATRPFDEMMDAAARIADGDYSTRISERGPREVRDLTRAFNTMTGRLQTNAEQRRRLLADLSHELRTPLTVMQGNIEGLLDGIYAPDNEHLEALLEETRLMFRLIDDLRTLALTESGTLKLEREPTDLGVLANEVAASFRAAAQAAGVQLTVEVAPDLPLIELDPARIHQVLTNLIANALRYTASGGQIQVQGELHGADLRVTVSDTGRGIAPQDLPHIFDRYYKSSDSRGTGLGLAIAKSLVTAHGGAIMAQSEMGKGTTIVFTLPVKNLSGA